MFCVFNTKTGEYCDREDSFVKIPTDAEWIASGNVMGRNGGEASDYAVVETDDPQPYLCRLVDGRVVRDKTLVDAVAARDQERVAAKAKDDMLLDKVEAGTATAVELRAVVLRLAGRG